MILQFFLVLKLVGDCNLQITLIDFSARLNISSFLNNLMEVKVCWIVDSLRMFLFFRIDKFSAANLLSLFRTNSLLLVVGENSSRLLIHFSLNILAGLLESIAIQTFEISLCCYHDNYQIVTDFILRIKH